MTAQRQGFVEVAGSRKATIKRLGKRDESTVDVTYRAVGFPNDTAVHAECVFFFNTNFVYNAGGQVLLIDSYDITHLGGDCWEIVGHYVSLGTDASQGGEEGEEPPQPTPLKRSRQFDTTGGTSHITAAYSERRYAAAGGAAPSMGGAIEVDGTNIKGVDVVVPQMQWSESYDVPASLITTAYIKALSNLTGTINDAPFRGFAAQEVLFAGASGSQQWDDQTTIGPWSLTYKFIGSPNVTGLTVGGVTGIAKNGHDYLWALYEPTVDQQTLATKAKAVYCNQVYRTASFAGLGIGN